MIWQQKRMIKKRSARRNSQLTSFRCLKKLLQKRQRRALRKPSRTSKYELTAGRNRLSRRLSFLSVRAEPEEQQTAEAVPGTELPFREAAARAKNTRPPAQDNSRKVPRPFDALSALSRGAFSDIFSAALLELFCAECPKAFTAPPPDYLL